jgi:hypothetical protein
VPEDPGFAKIWASDIFKLHTWVSHTVNVDGTTHKNITVNLEIIPLDLNRRLEYKYLDKYRRGLAWILSKAEAIHLTTFFGVKFPTSMLKQEAMRTLFDDLQNDVASGLLTFETQSTLRKAAEVRRRNIEAGQLDKLTEFDKGLLPIYGEDFSKLCDETSMIFIGSMSENIDELLLERADAEAPSVDSDEYDQPKTEKAARRRKRNAAK